MLVADDNVLVRDLLQAVFSGADDFELVATAGDAVSAAERAGEHRPGLALVDVRMPGGGPAAARGILEASPDTLVVALSNNDDAESVRLMLAAGAASYMVKGTPPDELLEGLRATVAPPRAPDERVVLGPPRRVLVTVTDAVALDELAESIIAAPGLELSGLAQTAYHAITLSARLRPDIAVVDASMSTGGARIAAAIVAASPATRVIAWALPGDPRTTLGLVGAGAANVVVSGAEPATAILEAVDSAIQGGPQSAAGAPLVILRGTRTARPHDLPDRGRFERLGAVLRSRRLDIALQAVVSLTDDRVHGYEALARFPQPGPGPDVWFAEAHRAGVGIELERLAVRCALRQLDRMPPDVFLSINVSPDTAGDPGLADDLAGFDGSRIVLELTEHAPVTDYGVLAAGLGRLRERGARVAVDDCGGGYSSLRHAALVAPEFLKLDMVLGRHVTEPARAALTRALVGFARETGSLVIAEGIEEPADLEALRHLGVALGQGHLLSRPAPAAVLLSP